MEKYFQTVSIKKKENLLEAGKICGHNYFVAKGLLRLFFINDKGGEQNTEFAMEDWWMADYSSFANKSASGFFIQAVESSTVIAISKANQDALLLEFPAMEKYFRVLHQRAHAAAQSRIKLLYDFSREELYHNFCERYPDFVQRVPQYLLASFLGFTPEYLSEIRKKKMS